MKTQLLKLEQIHFDGLQTRASLNEDTVAEYSEQMRANDKFPPLTVFHDGSQYFLADGFHRYWAAETIGLKEFPCDVRKGTRTDALKFALGANVTNGLRRTNADKLNCIKIALREFPKLSNVAIAEMCGVSDNFVCEHRPKQPQSDGGSETRIGKDGKERRMPVRPATITPPKSNSKVIVDDPPHVKSADEITTEKSPFDEPTPAAWEQGKSTAGTITESAPEDNDSDTLYTLKRAWKKATEKERTEFKKWIENDSN